MTRAHFGTRKYIPLRKINKSVTSEPPYLRSSPGKVEDFQEICRNLGEKDTMPPSFCSSRWLDRHGCIVDILERIDTYREYYKQRTVPRSRKKDDDISETGEDSDSSQEEEPKVKDFLKDPAGRVKFLKTKFVDPGIDSVEALQTEIELLVAADTTKPGYEFLKIFQSPDVKIHLLYNGYQELLKSAMLQIVHPASLRNSRGEKLSGEELKFLVLETKEERTERKLAEAAEKENNNNSAKHKKQVEEERQKRRAMVLPTESTLVSMSLREKLNILYERVEPSKKEREEIVTKVKNLKCTYYRNLVKALQHYLPLDNNFLRWLKFLCPKIFNEKLEAEAYIIKIAQKVSFVKEIEEDDLRLEIRKLKEDKEKYFDEELEVYCRNYVEGFKKQDGKEKTMSIDIIWRPIIKNQHEFPILSKFLKGALCMFHSTATVEGAINTTRNILGERSHNMKDENLNARKQIKSAVKISKAECCYDYDLSDKAYHENWKKAYKNMSEGNGLTGHEEKEEEESR